MLHTASSALAAALLIATLAPATAGASSAATSQQGEFLEPGSNQDNAPVIQPGSYYTGTFSGETAYYRVERTMTESTVHAGITTHNADGAHTEGAEISLSTLSGETCDGERLGWTGGAPDALFHTAQISATSPLDPEHHNAIAECGTAEELLLAVQATDEQIVGQGYELILGEEPEPLNAEELREAFDDQQWDADAAWQQLQRERDAQETIEPGTSLHNAPQLEKASTADTTIQTGQVHIYRIPAEWNELVQAEAFFPEPASELAEQLGGIKVRMDILSPYWGQAGPASHHSAPAQNSADRIDTSSATTLSAASYPVNWSGRYSGSPSGSNSQHASITGDYFLLISADEQGEGEEPFDIPYRLTADTFSAGADQEPIYRETLLQPGDNSEAEESAAEQMPEAEDGAALADQRSGGISAATGIALSLGAFGLLLIVAGGLYLLRLSRQNS